MRRVRELMKTDPAFAHTLRNALVSAAREPASKYDEPMRWAAPPRNDADSVTDAGDLLRMQSAAALEKEPVYAPQTRTALQAVVNEHQVSESLLRSGLAPTKTLLLCGPPGVGKTLAATWIARELHKPLLVLDLGTVMSRYLGATGANLSRAFSHARQVDGILFLDELDALAKRRDDSADVGELKRLVTVLLQQLDEWPSSRLLIAATNHPQLLDTAVWRRFEERVEFQRPGAQELRALIETLLPPGGGIPSIWMETLPAIFAQTSQSELIRTFRQLRKLSVLEPNLSATQALARVGAERIQAMPRKEARELAITLARQGELSLRQISELTHVSRDTLRRAGIRGT
jgi:hypothetical protein